MKAIFKFLIPFVIFFNFSYTISSANITYTETPTQGDRLAQIKERGVLHVVASDDVPFAYINPKTDEFTGINADIIKEAARRLGINKVIMHKVPFDNLLTELNSNDEIDVMADRMYITNERKKLASFTDVMYKESEAIVTPKISKINFKENLKDAVIGAQAGTVFLRLVENWQDVGIVKDVKVFPDQDSLLDAVNNSKIDAAIVDSIVAAYLIANDSSLYLRELSPKEYTPELPGNIGAAVRKEDTTLLNALNKVIDDMKKDLTIQKILKKYGVV